MVVVEDGAAGGDGFLALPVALSFDDELERGGLEPVDRADWASSGSAIMVTISAGSRLEVVIVEWWRWRSTTSS